MPARPRARCRTALKSRQRLGPRRRRSAADRRAGSATAVLRWSFELSPPRAGEVAPVRHSSRAPQDVPGGDRTGWERFARFVVAEFERYLQCGILANGFARVRCVDWGDELL